MRALRKRYRRLDVLRGVDLSVPRGSITALVGLNGSGKTTTIECVLGLQRFDGGEVSVLGERPGRLHRIGRRLGVVFDSPCLPPGLTVRGVLEHARRLCGGGGREPAELERLLGLERFSATRIRRLSLGGRRRASIACALAGAPELVLLDEPFAALDAEGVDTVIDLLVRLNRDDGTTFLLSSHQLPYLERVATHAAVLHDGRIRHSGGLRGLLEGLGTRLRVRVSEPERARAWLASRDDVAEARVESDGRVAVELGAAGPAALNTALVRAGFEVAELLASPPSLESLVRRLTEGGAR